MKSKENLWPPEGGKGFKEIQPSDLIFDSAGFIFKIDQDMIKKFLVKFMKTEAKL